MRAWTVVVLVLAAPLAGCTGSDGPDDDTDPTPQRIETELPTWEIGDAWTYKVNARGFGEQTVRLINYKDDRDQFGFAAGHYWLGAESKDKAVLHALYNAIPVLGRIHINNLAPHENGSHAHMYEFPLWDGKQWGGPLYGYTFDFTAERVENIQTPVGPSPGYAVSGSGPLARIELDYAENVEWFTTLELFSRDGDELLTVELTNFAKGQRGAYHFMRADDLALAVVGETQGQTRSIPFSVPPGGSKDDDRSSRVQYSAIYAGFLGVARGSVRVALIDPSGDTVVERTWGPLGAATIRTPLIVEAPRAPEGQWRLEYSSLGASDLEVRIAGIKQYDQGQV